MAKKSRNKASLFVKNMTVAVFGTKTLLEKTVTGYESNRNKNKNAAKRDTKEVSMLDPTKILAIKGTYNFQKL